MALLQGEKSGAFINPNRNPMKEMVFMRKPLYILGTILCAALIVGTLSLGFFHFNQAKASSLCTPTGYTQNGVNLTAALIVSGLNKNVTGTVYATGCNIGIYYSPGSSGTIQNADVSGATYYGILNNGGSVIVNLTRVHDIGDNPLDGLQQGIGIDWAEGSSAKGTISNDLVWNYQKDAIFAGGSGTQASISHNTIIGQGPIGYIAQNGIEFDDGAKGTISNNFVTGNAYTGSGLVDATGILVSGGSCFGAPLVTGTTISSNILVGNDVGILTFNVDNNCQPVTTPTKLHLKNNIISNDGVNNTSGHGVAGQGYQAGISDTGDGDTITSNNLCGTGYTAVVTPPPFLTFIDLSFTNSPVATGNISCLDGSAITPSILAIAQHAHMHAPLHPSRAVK